MGKKLLYGSNLKMYKGVSDTKQYLRELIDATGNINSEEIEMFIIPSYVALESAINVCKGSHIKIGAQNMHWETEGQYTGEISPKMLKEMGVSLIMAGHSERRHIFGETDEEENKKIKSAVQHGFSALLCVGETEKEKEYGIGMEVLKKQLHIGFYGISESDVEKLWVAYEPVWAIGVNGTPPSAEYVEKMHQTIKKELYEIFGEKGREIPVLYGGSVNHSNAEHLITLPSVDGLFVGRAAWDASSFDKLIRESQHAYLCAQNEESIK